MAHRMLVDIDGEEDEIEYDLIPGQDDPSVGYRAPPVLRIHDSIEPQLLSDVVRQILARHVE